MLGSSKEKQYINKRNSQDNIDFFQEQTILDELTLLEQIVKFSSVIISTSPHQHGGFHFPDFRGFLMDIENTVVNIQESTTLNIISTFVGG